MSMSDARSRWARACSGDYDVQSKIMVEGFEYDVDRWGHIVIAFKGITLRRLCQGRQPYRDGPQSWQVRRPSGYWAGIGEPANGASLRAGVEASGEGHTGATVADYCEAYALAELLGG